MLLFWITELLSNSLLAMVILVYNKVDKVEAFRQLHFFEDVSRVESGMAVVSVERTCLFLINK